MLLDALFLSLAAEGYDKAAGQIQDVTKGNDALEKSAIDSQKAIEGQNSSLMSLVKTMAGGFLAAFSLGQVISSVFERTEIVVALKRTSETLGIAIEDLDAFGKAAVRAGGDAQGASDSLTDMAEAMGEALSDKESGKAKAFKALGINIADATGKAKDGLTGILELSKAVEGLDRSTAIFKIKELGITDNRTIDLILKGRVELERMIRTQKEQGVVTKEVAERAQKLSDSFAALKGATADLGSGMFDKLVPAFTVVVEWLTKIVDWVGENQQFVIAFFAAIAAVVIGTYLPAMISAAAATLAATWPLIAIGVAVAAVAAAFALAYDDIVNFMEGNDSLIGQIFEKYPAVKDAVMGLVEVFKFFGEIVSGVWDIVLTGFKQMLNFVLTGIKQIASGVSSVASFFGIGSDEEGTESKADTGDGSLPDGRDASFGLGVLDQNEGKFQKSDEQSSNGRSESSPFVSPKSAIPTSQLQDKPNRQDEMMGAARGQIVSAQAAPTNSITSNAISNSSNITKENNVQIGEITVNSQATDGAGVAKDVGSELKSQLKDLEQNSASGIDR